MRILLRSIWHSLGRPCYSGRYTLLCNGRWQFTYHCRKIDGSWSCTFYTCSSCSLGYKPVQEVLVSTLEHVVEDVEKAQLKAPAIIVVGDVVNLREKLQWFDNKPLFGKTIVVTRARSQASAFREKLAAQGANVVEAAAIKTSPLELFDEDKRIINNTKQYQCIVFTSGEGVRYFFDALYKEGKDTRALGNSKVAAIGCATARELQNTALFQILFL